MALNGKYTEKKELSPKQLLFLDALIAGNRVPVAAKLTGVAERTAYNWFKLPHFKIAYRDAKQELFDEKLEEIKDGIHIALDALKRNMSEDTRGYVQVQAASKWLDIAIELYKSQELEERLKELEDAIKDMQR